MADVCVMWMERLSNLESKMDFIVQRLVNLQRDGKTTFEYSGKRIIVDIHLCREIFAHGVYIRPKETPYVKIPLEIEEFAKNFFPNEYTLEDLSKLRMRDIYPGSEDIRDAIQVVLSEYVSQKGMADYLDDEYGIYFDNLGDDVYTAIEKACKVWEFLGADPKEVVVESYGHTNKSRPSRFARLVELYAFDLAPVSLSSPADGVTLYHLVYDYIYAIRWRDQKPDIPRHRGLSLQDTRDLLSNLLSKINLD